MWMYGLACIYLGEFQSLHFFEQLFAHLGRASGHDDAGLFERVDLILGASLASGDDGTGVTHPTARRSRQTGNEGDHWLGLNALVVLHQIIGSLFLSDTTNLTDQDNTLGIRILQEDFQAIDEIGSVEGIASNADAKRLAETHFCRLVHGLIGQCSRTGHDTDLATLMDVSRHDTDLALFGSNDSWAVGANQTGFVLSEQGVLYFDHVVLRDSLSNAHHQRDLRFDGLHNGIGCPRGRNVDDGGIRTGGRLRFLHRIEHRKVQMLATALSGGNSSDQLRSVLEGLLGVEGALLSRESLADDLRVRVELQILPSAFITRKTDAGCETIFDTGKQSSARGHGRLRTR